MGILGFILAILSSLPNVLLIFGIPAIIFSIIGIAKGDKKNRIFGVVGLIIAIVIQLIIIISAVQFRNEMFQTLQGL